MRASPDRRALPLRSADLAQLAPATIMVLPPRDRPRGGKHCVARAGDQGPRSLPATPNQHPVTHTQLGRASLLSRMENQPSDLFCKGAHLIGVLEERASIAASVNGFVLIEASICKSLNQSVVCLKPFHNIEVWIRHDMVVGEPL